MSKEFQLEAEVELDLRVTFPFRTWARCGEGELESAMEVLRTDFLNSLKQFEAGNYSRLLGVSPANGAMITALTVTSEPKYSATPIKENE